MEVVLVLVVLALAVALIAGPLRRSTSAAGPVPQPPERAELEAVKEAKYREIRDAELDYRTGKLSYEDWRRLDSSLRREAILLLRRLDALEGGEQADRRERSG
jgi:hypothetical protein